MRNDLTQRVLQLIYDRFYEDGGEWPTLGYLQRALNRQSNTSVNAARIVQRIPATLLKPLHSIDGYPPPTEKLVLTVEAIERCTGSGEDIGNFTIAVRWLGKRAERSDQPGDQGKRGMRFTTRQLAEGVSLSLQADQEAVGRLVAMLQAEGWVHDDGRK